MAWNEKGAEKCFARCPSCNSPIGKRVLVEFPFPEGGMILVNPTEDEIQKVQRNPGKEMYPNYTKKCLSCCTYEHGRLVYKKGCLICMEGNLATGQFHHKRCSSNGEVN